jgi:hypothetical protein
VGYLNHLRTREGMAIAKRKANCAANSPNYRLSAALHPPPLRHREVSLADLAKAYNDGRFTILILTNADAPQHLT